MKKLTTAIIIALLATAGNAQNTNANDSIALRLECPHLSSDTLYSVYGELSTDDYGITYAYEFDLSKRANRWVCYQMHNGNRAHNTWRYNRWYEDTDINATYRITMEDYYDINMDKGHLCASQDRVCNMEQNKQTFLLGTNSHPQYNKHNVTVWAAIENWIVNKLNYLSFRDTLYVVKAATIDDDHIGGYTRRTKLIIPAYWYAALLCVKDSTYKAIGVLTEHTNARICGANPYNYCVSIDSLETLTGLDFFCNLPDSIEAAVQAECAPEDWLLEAD